MSQHLAIFQVGPVQEYIFTAKRTQDFWAGSCILSYLAAVAVATVEGQCPGSIVYPLDRGGNSLLDVVKTDPGDCQRHDFSSFIEGFIPTLPNRMVACHSNPDQLKASLENARENVLKVYKCIDGKVKDQLRTILRNPNWQNVWDRQTRDVWIEVYWIIYSQGPAESYSEAYANAERYFGARKAIRNFTQNTDGESGHKCTLCGEREALWRDTATVMKRELRYVFRVNERLCNPCTVKRLAPQFYFKANLEYPSTSSVAAAGFLDELAAKLPTPQTKALSLEFIEAFNDMGLERFPRKCAPLPYLANRVETCPPECGLLFNLDGDAFIPDNYQALKLIKEYRSTPPADMQQFEESVKICKGKLAGLMDRVGDTCKYYGVIMMDGDRMGEKLRACASEEEHQEFSAKLGAFSHQVVPLIAEGLFRAKVIYFGGDEGIIFCTLEDTLPLIRALRAAFSGHVKAGPDGGVLVDFGMDGQAHIDIPELRLNYAPIGTDATASVGVVVAHHQQALLQVMGEAAACLEIAKDKGDRNAFCIALMKRAGGTTRSFAKWFFKDEQLGTIDTIGHLEAMKELYRIDPGGLSPRWLQDLHLTKGALKPTSRPAVGSEMKRIALRHCGKPCQEQLKSLLNEAAALVSKLLPEAGRDVWENLIQLESVANYIAKGGGK